MSHFDLSIFLIRVSKMVLQSSYPVSSWARTLRDETKLYFLAKAWRRLRWARPERDSDKLYLDAGSLRWKHLNQKRAGKLGLQILYQTVIWVLTKQEALRDDEDCVLTNQKQKQFKTIATWLTYVFPHFSSVTCFFSLEFQLPSTIGTLCYSVMYWQYATYLTGEFEEFQKSATLESADWQFHDQRHTALHGYLSAK